ncbi:MAG: hypothetical protein SFX73_10885 [Kofleriaceae bacterium]|nr:hypothetical protein [Kofleriaceae bacterium]
MGKRALAIAVIALVGATSETLAQPSLVCPKTSVATSFVDETMSTDCSGTVTTGCTSKAGVSYVAATDGLQLPVSAGNFSTLSGATIEENVLFAAVADFDKDGWEDIAAADDYDKHVIMRNQTITCGTGGCTTTSVQPIPGTWWNTLANKRRPLFKTVTNGSGGKLALKPIATGAGAVALRTPMVAGDFDGDSWPDFVAVSHTYVFSTSVTARAKYPTAARLYLNTKNCRNTTTQAPCGVGMLCPGQTANGACSGTAAFVAATTSGSPFLASDLSCTSTSVCAKYYPTFATYDLQSGAAVSTNNSYTVSPNAPTVVGTKPGDFGPLNRPTTQIQALDWDGDGDLDILYGHGVSESYTCPSSLCSAGGQGSKYAGIDVWLNDCAQSAAWSGATKSCAGHVPRFSHAWGTCSGTTCNSADVLVPSTAHNSSTLAPNANLGFDYAPHQVPVFAYKDVDNDNDRDLVLGSVGCCDASASAQYKLRVYKNTSGSLYTHTLDTANPLVLSTSNATYGGFEGSLTAVFVDDFSGDGYADIITASDALSYPSAVGGRVRYWRNSGDASRPFGTNWPSCVGAPQATNIPTCTTCSATCNPNPTLALAEAGAPADDFDFGFIMNYDNDPAGTKDLLLTDGAGGAADFYVFPNRANGATVPACGSAISGTLPTPPAEATVTGACITPDASFGNATSSVRYYLSNETPANYLYACTQTTSGVTPSPCCVSFTNLTGSTITWKAELDTDTSDDGGSNKCSVAGSESPSLKSVAATYTYNEAQQHFRAGVVVSDGIAYVGSFRQPGHRGHFYALAAGDGTRYYDASEKIDAQTTRNIFTADNVGASVAPIAFSPVSPSSVLAARVGASTPAEATAIIDWVRSARFGLADTSKLGAVMGSTPAILTPPFRPSWYAYLSSSDKALYDTFATTHASRVPLALFASMDGMLHAIISIATDISNPVNGTEAWAFIPPYVAASMKADFLASTVSTYTDGSPTLVDYRKSNGTIATVALIGDGAGGGSLTALDVTDTVSTTFAVTPPDPMWSVKPGDTDAGKAISKPAVARVRLASTQQEAFVVIAGTGLDSSAPSKGKVVSGYNLETGALLWKFEAECPITTDISAFETDDENEPGAPTLDGFADRAVFADNCGNVYKIPVDQDVAGGWLGNEQYGAIELADSNGVERRVLFSTAQSGALGAGQQRPIAGTIGVRADTSADLILFFGTGGLEAYDVTKVNEFYAVRAKDGTIRNKLTGTCVAGRCEKFYGGVVISPEVVIIHRSIDPVIGGGTCDYGSSKVQFLDPTTLAKTEEVTQVGGKGIDAVASPMFGDAGALYFTTVSGEIKRIGQPRATVAGQDTDNGTMQNESSGSEPGEAPLTLVGWRVVL